MLDNDYVIESIFWPRFIVSVFNQKLWKYRKFITYTVTTAKHIHWLSGRFLQNTYTLLMILNTNLIKWWYALNVSQAVDSSECLLTQVRQWWIYERSCRNYVFVKFIKLRCFSYGCKHSSGQRFCTYQLRIWATRNLVASWPAAYFHWQHCPCHMVASPRMTALSLRGTLTRQTS